MKRTIIKTIDEQFAQTISGDGYNSSNGVFKVNYKAYADLSLAVGRDPDPSILIKDSQFQIGDIVSGKINNKDKKIKGEVIETTKSLDGKSYIIKIQSLKDKKIYTLIPGSIQFIQDRGYSRNSMGMNVTSRERNAQNLKYNGGNIVWGSLENKKIDEIPVNIEEENENIIDGIMGTGWKIKLVDELPSSNTLLNTFVIDHINNIIISLISNHQEDIKSKLKAAEAYCFICYHPSLNEYPTDVKSLAAIIFLEIKNEEEAKKYLVQNFHQLEGKSYGESRDKNLDKAKSIINSFF